MTTTISYRERFLGKRAEINLSPGDAITLYVSGFFGLFKRISQTNPILYPFGVSEYHIKELQDGSGVHMTSWINGRWYNPGKEEVTGKHSTSFGVTIDHHLPEIG